MNLKDFDMDLATDSTKKAAKTKKVTKTEKTAKVVKAARAEKVAKVEKVAKAEKVVKAEKVIKVEKPAKTEKNDNESSKVSYIEPYKDYDSMFSYYSDVPESLGVLKKGYDDYAKEVVLERAIPSIDGLKVGNRRLLYAMRYLSDKDVFKDLAKSFVNVGSALKIHPHGDAAVYQTLCLMVDGTLHNQVLPIQGKGAFGKHYSSMDTPAAMRYTESKLADIAREYFNEMDGVDMVPSFDGSYKEPNLLPVSFPSILTNNIKGLAVGLSTDIPSFNFNELINYTIAYIKGKSFNTAGVKKLKPLYPDFPTGGSIIINDSNKGDYDKIMESGDGKIYIQGKWHIEGKSIIIDEIPYQTSIEQILASADKIPDVVDTKDLSDKRGLKGEVICASKSVVQDVLNILLHNSTLRMVVNTNILVIVDDTPRFMGVDETIEEWVKFRRAVLTKSLNVRINNLKDLILKYDILVDIMTTKKRNPFLDSILHGTEKDTNELLASWYKDVPQYVFDWIMERTLKSLRSVGDKQKEYLVSLRAELKKLEGYLADIDSLIIEQLTAINKKYKYPRKSEILNIDISDKPVRIKKEDNSDYLVQIDGLFLRKLKVTPGNIKLPNVYEVNNKDYMLIVSSDNCAHRIAVDSLKVVNSSTDKGQYIPQLLKLDEHYFTTYDIWYIGPLKSDIFMVINGIGKFSLLDTSKWDFSGKVVKSLKKVFSPKMFDSNVLYIPLLKESEAILLHSSDGKRAILTYDTYKEFLSSGRYYGKFIGVKDGVQITSAELLDASTITKDSAFSKLKFKWSK